MNKKQLIAVWVVGLLLCGVWAIVLMGVSNILFFENNFSLSVQTKPLAFLLFFSFPIIIIGGLLIYTLGDKKPLDK